MYMNESPHVHSCAMPYIWMSHLTNINELCHLYEGVNHLHINASCRKLKWVTSHTSMSHVTYWMSHLTYMNASCHVYGWVRERRRRLASNYENPSVPGWGIQYTLRGFHFGIHESPSEQKMEGYEYWRKQSTSFVLQLGLPALMAPWCFGF